MASPTSWTPTGTGTGFRTTPTLSQTFLVERGPAATAWTGSRPARTRCASGCGSVYVSQYFDGVRLIRGHHDDAHGWRDQAGRHATMVPGGTIVGSIDPSSYWYDDSNHEHLAGGRVQACRRGVGIRRYRTGRRVGGVQSWGPRDGFVHGSRVHRDGDVRAGGMGELSSAGLRSAEPRSLQATHLIHLISVTENLNTFLPETMVLQSVFETDRGAPVSSIDAPSGWVHNDVTIHITAVDAAGAPFVTYGALAPLVPARTLPTITAKGRPSFATSPRTRTATARPRGPQRFESTSFHRSRSTTTCPHTRTRRSCGCTRPIQRPVRTRRASSSTVVRSQSAPR